MRACGAVERSSCRFAGINTCETGVTYLTGFGEDPDSTPRLDDSLDPTSFRRHVAATSTAAAKRPRKRDKLVLRIKQRHFRDDVLVFSRNRGRRPLRASGGGVVPDRRRVGSERGRLGRTDNDEVRGGEGSDVCCSYGRLRDREVVQARDIRFRAWGTLVFGLDLSERLPAVEQTHTFISPATFPPVGTVDVDGFLARDDHPFCQFAFSGAFPAAEREEPGAPDCGAVIVEDRR